MNLLSGIEIEMRMLKLLCWSAPAIILGVFAGCHQANRDVNTEASGHTPSSKIITNPKKNRINKKPMKNVPKSRLIVSKPNNAGRLVQLGTVNFDDSNRASLATEGS